MGEDVFCCKHRNIQGWVRIGRDYKQLNELIPYDFYKFPNVEDLFAKLVQGESPPAVLSCLDLSGTFTHLLIDEEAANILVLNAHMGLLGTQRLPYDAKITPSQFHSAMDKILDKIDHTACCINDILVETSDV